MAHVLLGKEPVELTAIASHGVQNKLAALYRVTQTCLCCCQEMGLRNMVIYRRGGTYYLRRFPKDGPHHNPMCRFYSPTTNAAGQGKQAIIVDEEGNIDAKINIRFSQANGKPTSKTTHIGTTRCRNKTTLLGWLNALWYEYSLEYYKPDTERSYRHLINKRFFAALHKTKINGRAARDSVFISSPDFNFSARYVRTKVTTRYPILIGLVESFVVDDENSGIQIAGLPTIIAEKKQIDEYIRSCNNRAAWQINEGQTGHDLAILQVEIKKIKRETVLLLIGHTLQTVALTNEFVAFDSRYEKQFAEHLVDHGRAFKKPIKSTNGMMPDFVLTDVVPRCFIEVWVSTSPK